VDFNTYDRVAIVFPDLSPSCNWAGLSSIGCYNVTTSSGTFNVSTSVLVWNNLTTVNNIGYQVIFHELGHQLGLAHSRLRVFTDTNNNPIPLGALGTTGTLWEYAGHESVMGFADGHLGHYGAAHKAELLNWLPGSDYQLVQGSGTYTIQPYETSLTGPKALKIQRGTGNDAWLWVEYRQNTGLYDSTLPNSQMYTGALIHYEDSVTNRQTDLLDFTAPASYSDNPVLAAGQTWTDPYTNVSLSVLSATSAGLTVSVNYGAVPCTPANATVTTSPLDPSIYPGNSTAYTVSVTDNDSAECSAATFNLGSTQPSGWPTSFSATALTLNPGQSASVTMIKTGPSGTPAGTYAVNATAANAANSSYGRDRPQHHGDALHFIGQLPTQGFCLADGHSHERRRPRTRRQHHHHHDLAQWQRGNLLGHDQPQGRGHLELQAQLEFPDRHVLRRRPGRPHLDWTSRYQGGDQ